MCGRCDYVALMRNENLDCTPSRLAVLEIVGNSSSPLSAREIFETLNRTQEVNRVTVYRVLDLLVESGLVERMSAGDRTFRYGLGPSTNHPRHPHFYCTHCGNMECLGPEALSMSTASLERTFPGEIQKIEVRIDGICKNCLKRQRK